MGALFREDESFEMLTSNQKHQLCQYRSYADTVTHKDNKSIYSYGESNTFDVTDIPETAQIILNNEASNSIETVGFTTPPPIFGACQTCTSRKICRAKQHEWHRSGFIVFRCGLCGEVGYVRYLINNGQEHGWVTDRPSYKPKPKYRITNVDNRCYRPNLRRGIDNYIEIQENIPHKQMKSIISLDHRPKIWVKDSGLAAGLFLSEDVKNEWLDTNYNPNTEVDFSNSNPSTKRKTIIAPLDHR